MAVSFRAKPRGSLTILWDVDGTLLECSSGSASLHRQVLAQVLGEPSPLLQSLSAPVQGSTDFGIFYRWLITLQVEAPQFHAERAVDLLERVASERTPSAVPVPGSLAALQRATDLGVRALAFTGNSYGRAKVKLLQTPFETLLEVEPCLTGSRARSKAEMLRDAQSWLLEMRRTIIAIVGDTPADIEAARALRIPSVAVATGLHSPDQLQECNPDVYLKDWSSTTGHWDKALRCLLSR